MACVAPGSKIDAALTDIDGRYDSPSLAEGLDTLAQPRGGRGYFFLMVTVALVSMVAPLNSTMIAVALPDIREDLDVSRGEVAWLVSLYLIAMAASQPLGGRLGDQMGRVKTLRLGLIVFFLCSLAAAVTTSFETLVVFRTGQALVGAAVIPNGLAMLRDSIPTRRLGVAMGGVGSMSGLAAAMGPLLGAGLIELGNWRWLFLANLPLVGLALASLMLLTYQQAPSTQRLKLDLTGGLSLAGLLVLLTYLINPGTARSSGATLLAVPGLLGLGLLFVWRQARSELQVAEWRLFRIRTFAASTATLLLTNLGMYTTALTIPFFVEEVQGHSTSTVGALLAGETIFMALLGPVAGRLSDMYGRRLPATIGGGLQCAGALLLVLGLSEGASYAFLALCLGLQGAGFSLVMGPATTASVEAAPPERAGAAAGTNSMMRYFGSIVGIALLGGILRREGDATPEIESFRLGFAVLLVAGVLATLAAMMMHRFVGETRSTRTPAVAEPASAPEAATEA